jgi:hypothetical protein
VTSLTRQPLMSAGLALGLLAALLACFAGGRDIASGPARDFEPPTTAVELPAATIVVFVIGAALLAAALVIPAAWAKIVGVGVLTALASTCALIVIIGRSADDFQVDADLSLESGGILLATAFGLSVLALVLALVGSRELVPVLDPTRLYPGTSGKATTSLVLGIAGVFASIAAALAVTFSTLALGEIRQSEGRRTGRGLAIAGLVLGIVWLSLWALFLTVLIFASSPSAD